MYSLNTQYIKCFVPHLDESDQIVQHKLDLLKGIINPKMKIHFQAIQDI